MAKGDDIEERLIDFAIRIIQVCNALSNRPAEKHIRGQLIRSGTSPAPNYGEARGAESDKDFVHKLRIVLKELNESRIWLKILIRADLVPKKNLNHYWMNAANSAALSVPASKPLGKRRPINNSRIHQFTN